MSCHHIAEPPEIIRLCPFVYEDPGEHKCVMLQAISSRVARRRRGDCASISCLVRSVTFCVSSVRSIFGDTILAVMLNFPYSTAIDLVKPARQFLFTMYEENPGGGVPREYVVKILTIRPNLRSIIFGRINFRTLIGPRRPKSIARSKSPIV